MTVSATLTIELRFGADRAPSPDVRYGHAAIAPSPPSRRRLRLTFAGRSPAPGTALRSLDADCAPASCLRLSATPALGARLAQHGLAAVRGCPCPVAGRSLRPSWPSLTRCWLRFGILPALVSNAGSRGPASPSRMLHL